ncbi:MAG: hypothetical protein WED04_10190 [Promethearchaeati archaeon SRVP18_Atabeyarchaeia-1]
MAVYLASTLDLILQSAVLVILIAGIGLEKRNRKLGMTLHHNLMATAILLNIIGFILAMLPSMIYFLSELAALDGTTLLLAMVHAIFGALGIIFGVAFVVKLLPKKLQLWMRLTALFWFVALAFGFLQYFHLAGVF